MQAAEFDRDLIRDNAERSSWFNAYNRALRAFENSHATTTLPPGTSFASLHATTTVQLLSDLSRTFKGDPVAYAATWFWETFCQHVLGVSDWEAARRSHVFQEWLSALAVQARERKSA